MNNRFALKLMVLPLIALSFLGQATLVAAETMEITIEGNGSGSDNQVQVQSTTTTTVEQNNTANVQNNVESNADTGNNEANQNTGGDTAIQTGDIAASTNVENSMNTNAVEQCNCTGGSNTEIKVSGNGAGSSNIATVSNNQNTYVAQNNTANITNNVTVNANTGYNEASYNGGSVTIKTGNISATTNVENSNINGNYLKGFASHGNDLSINISGNGAYSENFVNFENSNDFVFLNNNTMNILNNIFHNLNTGHNKANGNLGDVAILTGDIKSVVNILNQGNNNYAEISCKGDKHEEKPPVSTPPTGNGGKSVGGASSSGNGGGGETLGVTTGEVLPVTGNLGLFLLTLFLGILLVSGWYLRTTSGVSPPHRV